MEELEFEVYTVFRMVLVLLEDMEQAFGIRMGRYRVKMFALETSFDKFFLFAHQVLARSHPLPSPHTATPTSHPASPTSHQVLAHYEDTHMTVDQLAHTLWQPIVQEFPTTIKRIASRQGKMGQLLHWWDMLERPRQWIIDSFRQTLTATIRKGLGVPAGAPQYDPRKLAIKDVRTYVQIRLTQIIRRDCLKLGRPVPADESKLSLLALWRHVRALAVARVVAKLHKHGVDVETPAEEGDGPGGLAAAGGLVAVYRGLVASILAALKAACEHEGLPPPQNEAASLSEWVESTENSLRLEYREMLRRHSFIDANSNRFRDERGLAELQRLSLAQLTRSLPPRRCGRTRSTPSTPTSTRAGSTARRAARRSTRAGRARWARRASCVPSSSRCSSSSPPSAAAATPRGGDSRRRRRRNFSPISTTLRRSVRSCRRPPTCASSCSAASTRRGRSSPRSSTTSATSSASTARRQSSSLPTTTRVPRSLGEATTGASGALPPLSVDVGGSSVSVGIGKPTPSKPNPSTMPSVTEVASASSVGGLGALAVPDAISERTEQPGSLSDETRDDDDAAAALLLSACTSRCSSELLISDVENPSGALPPLGRDDSLVRRGEASVSGERLRPRRRDVEGGARRDAGAERRGVGRGAA